MSAPDVLLDARVTRRMSVGMAAYAREVSTRLPRVAPDLGFEVFDRGGNFGVDEQVRLPWRAWQSGARIVHFLALYVPVVVPRPFAITIHDLIHLRFPQYFKAAVRPYYATVVRLACARARRVITDDPRTADDLVRLLGVARTKIRVIPLGIDETFLHEAQAERGPRPYFLYAGNHRAHKDIPTLVAAWQHVARERAVDLWLTGPNDIGTVDGRRELRGDVRFLGDVDASRLASLYRGASAYVHPAWCEGFGLPMLEAAAAGTRVIACRDAVPAVLESQADTFPARDERRLAELLRATLDRAPTEAERRGLMTLARAFTWDRCAIATAEVYREMLAE